MPARGEKRRHQGLLLGGVTAVAASLLVAGCGGGELAGRGEPGTGRAEAAGFAPSPTGDYARFVELWLPRLRDDDLAEEVLSARAYPQAILDEGFHGYSEPARRSLASCLFDADMAAHFPDDDLPAGYREELVDLLYLFVFDIENYSEEQPATDSNVRDVTSEVVTGEIHPDLLELIENPPVIEMPTGSYTSPLDDWEVERRPLTPDLVEDMRGGHGGGLPDAQDRVEPAP